MRWLPPILLGLAILPILGFCAIGALATLELETWEERAPWVLIYAVLALCCLIAEAALVRRAFLSSPRDQA
jgi:hypothetical protein